MKNTRLLSAAVAAALLAAGVAAVAAPPSPSASGSAATPRARTTPPRPLASHPIPSAPSERPTQDEWKSATQIGLPRVGAVSRACRAYLVREWLKVHCALPAGAVQQLAGPSEDVLVWVRQDAAETFFDGGGAAQLIFPLRAGDRRLFEIVELESEGYGGVWPATRAIVDEQWLPGEAAPRVVVR